MRASDFLIEKDLVGKPSPTLKMIASKFDVNMRELTTELMKGIEEEMEHTDSKEEAGEIALDHLWENPKYYTKLKKAMETKLELDPIEVGDEVKVGKFKNRKATVKGFDTDKNNQPVLKTDKGEHKLFKPRISKLEEPIEEETSRDDDIQHILGMVRRMR